MLRTVPFFFCLLTVLFIGLKMTDNIDWSWWWVFSPLWLPYLILTSIIGTVVLVIAAIQKAQDS